MSDLITVYGEHKTTYQRQVIPVPVKASVTIAKGFVDMDASGYLQPCGAGDIPYGWAEEEVTGGSADGDVSCKVDVGIGSLYRVEVGTGTITQAMQGKTCDLAGAKTIDVTASTDACIEIVQPLVADNEAIVRIVRPLLGTAV